jgi:hypothetical protein
MNDHACPSGESSIAANWSPHDLFHANGNNSVGYQSHLLVSPREISAIGRCEGSVTHFRFSKPGLAMPGAAQVTGYYDTAVATLS